MLLCPKMSSLSPLQCGPQWSSFPFPPAHPRRNWTIDTLSILMRIQPILERSREGDKPLWKTRLKKKEKSRRLKPTELMNYFFTAWGIVVFYLSLSTGCVTGWFLWLFLRCLLGEVTWSKYLRSKWRSLWASTAWSSWCFPPSCHVPHCYRTIE